MENDKFRKFIQTGKIKYYLEYVKETPKRKWMKSIKENSDDTTRRDNSKNQ